MARRVFFSFHYDADNWRASQVRNAGAVEANKPVDDNEWERITSGGDGAIKKWIADQMSGKSCIVVLIGNATAGRKWVKHEIKKGWSDGKGVVGIHIHNLKDVAGKQSSKGRNPFEDVVLNGNHKRPLSEVVKAYDPPFSTSTYVYDHIKNNIEDWVEEAIRIRSDH